jgi:hypothetical protein
LTKKKKKKQLKAGKLDAQAKKGHFVGFNGESKGYHIYWPGKRKVTIERDVYFNKNEVLQPKDVQIEGEWNIPNTSTNLDSPQPPNTLENPSNLSSNLQMSQTNRDNCLPLRNANKNLPMPSNNPVSAPSAQTTTVAQPQPRNHQISLQGLQQFDPSDYGQGKQVRNATSSHRGANVAECTEMALVIEDDGSLEPGGVKIDVNETEWFQRELSKAMVAYSEDEPTLKTVLGGREKESWWNTMEMELSQIKKLHTWDLVKPPPNANIIPSMYIF